MKLRYYCRQIWIASTIAGIAQSGQKRLIFIVVPQVRMEMREKGKRKKQQQQQQQYENE